MSKKRDKNTKDSKDKKHCKSRKTDDQKWERLDGYYKEYSNAHKFLYSQFLGIVVP